MDKPLIAWTIDAALNSKVEMDVIVSTNSKEIADISINYGAKIPFMRPDELARDDSTTIDAIVHAIRQMELLGRTYDHLLLLQPTSPLRTSRDIEQAIQFFKKKNAHSIVSVSQSDIPASWYMSLDKTCSLKPFIQETQKATKKRSQDLAPFHYLNGAIYFANIEKLLEHQTFYSLNMDCFAFPMHRKNGLDIDTEDEFLLAEMYLRLEQQISQSEILA